MSRFPRTPDALDVLGAEIEASEPARRFARETALHFVVDAATGRVMAELRGPDGVVLERMTPKAALAG